MKHYMGLDEDAYTKKEHIPVVYNPETLLNGHMLLTGISGSGKSFQTMRFLNTAAEAGIEIDIFDVHEELSHINYAKTAKISRHTRYGYNPLILNTDPHTGGPGRQADFLINLVQSVTPSMGDIQNAVLRNLILDTYMTFGIFENNSKSWVRKEITEATREAIMRNSNRSELFQYYPTLEDLIDFAKKKLKQLMIGADNPAVTAFEMLTADIKKLYQMNSKYNRAADAEEADKLLTKIGVLKEKCRMTYDEAIEALETGKEFDDMLKYGNAQQIASLVTRIELLNSSGIFRANAPPFGNAPVRVHQIQALTNEQQMLYTKIRLGAIFSRCVAMGPTKSGTELRHIIFVDEAQKFFVKDSNDIINVIAREARKFGLGLWMASQSPVGFPESFTRNVGATVLLGISSLDWNACMSMLRIKENMLQRIKPKELMCIKLQREGESNPQFETIILPNDRGALPARVAYHNDPAISAAKKSKAAVAS